MTNKIINTKEIEAVAKKLHFANRRIVLVGGCFDLLHVGHITFLEEAKKYGDTVVVFLESDETITATKGPRRPINSQEDRAKILAALETVDVVILLKSNMTDEAYDTLVIALKPAIIATTTGDSNRHHKERQANEIGAQVIDVTMPVHDQSTSKLIKLLDEI